MIDDIDAPTEAAASMSRVSSVRVRAVSPVAASSRRARSANTWAPAEAKISWAARSERALTSAG